MFLMNYPAARAMCKNTHGGGFCDRYADNNLIGVHGVAVSPHPSVRAFGYCSFTTGRSKQLFHLDAGGGIQALGCQLFPFPVIRSHAGESEWEDR